MRLRKLEFKDADGMLNWMKDPAVIQFFRMTADKATSESVSQFIMQAQNNENDLHLAIVDEADAYLGTISLKNIDKEAQNAEYAISTCSHVHGSGVAFEATREVLRIAFEDMKLKRVYLNVLDDNKRANRFYIKCGFTFEGCFRRHVCLRGELKDLNWYGILQEEYSHGKLK